MSNQNNILMKSMTKEEILIKSLIEEIQDAEKKYLKLIIMKIIFKMDFIIII